MAENKMKEIAKLLGVEMGVPFRVKDNKGNILTYSPYTLRYDGIYDKDNELRAGILTWLLNGKYEIKQPILDDVEKRYLEGVLRPFKDRVKYISKCEKYKADNEEFLYIVISSNSTCSNYEDISMPYFDKGTMYKGMKVDKEYTLEELGLFQD